MSKKKILGDGNRLAELLGISYRRVRQLVNEGVVETEADGSYDLPACIDAYYSFKYESSKEIDYLEEKAKHEAAKRELAEIELALKKKEIFYADDIERVMTDELSNLRSQLTGMPSKLAATLENRDAAFISNVLLDEINARLNELSQYSPELFEAKEEKK